MFSPAHRFALLAAALSPTLVAVPAAGAAAPAPAAATPRAAPAATPAASYRSCPSVKDIGPTGRDPADAVGLRAKVTSCRTARSVARRWVPATMKGSGDDVRVGRYRCVESLPGSRIAVRCTASGGRVVRFRLG